MVLAQQKQVDVKIAEQEVVLHVSPSAVAVIKNLLKDRNIPDYALRVFVSGGGCSGMQYGMSFEEHAHDYDTVVRVDGVSLLVDPTSMIYLKGANIDFVDSLIGGGFRIDNPNAVSSCGCGHSFKTADNEESDEAGGCSSCSH